MNNKTKSFIRKSVIFILAAIIFFIGMFGWSFFLMLQSPYCFVGLGIFGLLVTFPALEYWEDKIKSIFEE